MDLIIKFISNIHHVGSDESTVNQISGMSKAAGKFNFTIGTSTKKHHTGNSKQVQTDNSKSVTIKIPDCTPEDAAKIGTYIFNYVGRMPNTDKYVAAKSKFDTVKRQVLTELAVTDYNELTKEQRIMYARRMIAENAPFNYTECSVHIKYGDHMSIFSSTHRKIGSAHWTQDNADRIMTAAKENMKNYDVTLLKTKDNSQEVTPSEDSENSAN